VNDGASLRPSDDDLHDIRKQLDIRIGGRPFIATVTPHVKPARK
jgi:hypothetical protein